MSPEVCLFKSQVYLLVFIYLFIYFAASDKVDDPVCDVQISRMLELPCLYREVYDKPFQSPGAGQR